MDKFTPKKRKEIMSKISGSDTKPEILVRKFLFLNGLRYRKNVKKLPGSPDIVLSKYRTVVFVHGCFWHGHTDCKKAILPKTNFDFWRNKISKNIERDQNDKEKLEQSGWNVIVVWQCHLANKADKENTLSKLMNTIKMDRL